MLCMFYVCYLNSDAQFLEEKVTSFISTHMIDLVFVEILKTFVSRLIKTVFIGMNDIF